MNAQLAFSVEFNDFLSKSSVINMQYRFELKDKKVDKIERECIRMCTSEKEFKDRYYPSKIDWNSSIEIEPLPNMPVNWIFIEVLEQSITNISTQYKTKFESRVEETNIFGLQQKADFARYMDSKIPKMEEKLEKVDYKIELDLKSRILEQYALIKNYLNSHIIKVQSVHDRLNFKMNRNDVILLFYLLQEHGAIEMCEKQRLGSLIDILFNYEDEYTGEYLPIKDSRKLLSDLRKGSKQLDHSYDRLRDLFKKKIDFKPSPLE